MIVEPAFIAPGDSLPTVPRPFAALLEARDADWQDVHFVRRVARELLQVGCTWFVCFGQRAEEVHDCIDDVVVEMGCDGVVTTFHHDETEQEAADFFKHVTLNEMNGALVIADDGARWKRRLSSA